MVAAQREQERGRRGSSCYEQSRTKTAAEERVSLAELALVEGVFLRQWGSQVSGEGKFENPSGMCVRGEEVFVCDYSNHRIQVFARDGSFVRQWGSHGSGHGQFDSPSGVAVSKGEVFVSDSENHRIQVFGVDGSFTRQWGTRGSEQGEFNCPVGVAVSKGRFWSAIRSTCGSGAPKAVGKGRSSVLVALP